MPTVGECFTRGAARHSKRPSSRSCSTVEGRGWHLHRTLQPYGTRSLSALGMARGQGGHASEPVISPVPRGGACDHTDTCSEAEANRLPPP